MYKLLICQHGSHETLIVSEKQLFVLRQLWERFCSLAWMKIS